MAKHYVMSKRHTKDHQKDSKGQPEKNGLVVELF